MAERNMEATLSAFREAGDAIPTAYDLSLPELSRLVGRARTPQGACEAIGSAFRYGFILPRLRRSPPRPGASLLHAISDRRRPTGEPIISGRKD